MKDYYYYWILFTAVILNLFKATDPVINGLK